MRLKKDGDDGTCLSRITLIINDNIVFAKSLSPGDWLDGSENDRTLTIGLNELRSDARWARLDLSRTALSVANISRSDLESIISAHVAIRCMGKDSNGALNMISTLPLLGIKKKCHDIKGRS